MSGMVVLKPRHLDNVSDGTRRRSNFRIASNHRRDNRDKCREKEDVITGSVRIFSFQGSFPQGRTKYRECVGVFVSYNIIYLRKYIEHFDNSIIY